MFFVTVLMIIYSWLVILIALRIHLPPLLGSDIS